MKLELIYIENDDVCPICGDDCECGDDCDYLDPETELSDLDVNYDVDPIFMANQMAPRSTRGAPRVSGGDIPIDLRQK